MVKIKTIANSTPRNLNKSRRLRRSGLFFRKIISWVGKNFIGFNLLRKKRQLVDLEQDTSNYINIKIFKRFI